MFYLLSILLILIIPQNIFLINLNIILNYLPIDSELFFYLFSLDNLYISLYIFYNERKILIRII